ncbi:PepSY domain-containing protein [Polaribacter gochangensis]|uniref:PepSY domain-containing protein n=1 Tax=Polaribacter gochangensis TaxID=3252903 RepID=UPI003904C315
MSKKENKKKQAKVLRTFRKVHRITGATLFIFFFVVSISALLLGWKKNSFDYLLSETYEGSSTELKNWLPIDSLHTKANFYFKEHISLEVEPVVDRIDIRKEKGTAKFIFENYYGIQVDGATGDLLHVERRRSDFIEGIHDGSALDIYFNTSGDPIKLIYTTVMSLALLLFTITGFWLWLGPIRMRKGR